MQIKMVKTKKKAGYLHFLHFLGHVEYFLANLFSNYLIPFIASDFWMVWSLLKSLIGYYFFPLLQSCWIYHTFNHLHIFLVHTCLGKSQLKVFLSFLTYYFAKLSYSGHCSFPNLIYLAFSHFASYFGYDHIFSIVITNICINVIRWEFYY